MDAGNFKNVGGVNPHTFRAEKPALPKSEAQDIQAEQTDFVTLGPAQSKDPAVDGAAISGPQVDANQEVAVKVASGAGVPMILTEGLFEVEALQQSSQVGTPRPAGVLGVNDLTWIGVDNGKVITTLDPLVVARLEATREQLANAAGVPYAELEGPIGPNNLEGGLYRFS